MSDSGSRRTGAASDGTSVVDFRVRLPTELRPREERPREYIERYDAVLDLEARRDLSPQRLRDDMAQAGVEHAVVHAEYEVGDPADELNEAVAKLVAEEPTLSLATGRSRSRR